MGVTILAPARTLDPLVARKASCLAVAPSRAAARRSRSPAPDVRLLDGPAAVAIVRACGFIAAIEPVESTLRHGTVVEQDPPAGEAELGREATVTLRVAVQPSERREEPTQAEPQIDAETWGLSDDTEEWFSALAIQVGHGTHAARRRRMRGAAVSHEQCVSDAAHASQSGSIGSKVALAQSGRLERHRPQALIAEAVHTLLASAAAVSWRRRSAAVSALALLALLSSRVLAAGERQPRPVARRSSTLALSVELAPTWRSRPPSTHPSARLSRTAPAVSHPLVARVSAASPPSNTQERAVAVEPAARLSRSAVSVEPSAHAARTEGAPFTYLGQ